jgi:hypothetical protein
MSQKKSLHFLKTQRNMIYIRIHLHIEQFFYSRKIPKKGKPVA